MLHFTSLVLPYVTVKRAHRWCITFTVRLVLSTFERVVPKSPRPLCPDDQSGILEMRWLPDATTHFGLLHGL